MPISNPALSNPNLDNHLEGAVIAAAAGDAQAFTQLVEASQSTVTSIALAICRDLATSEDVAQEVYLLAWRRLGELRNPLSFLPWIRQVTRFTAKTRMRNRRTEQRHRDPAIAAEGFDALLAEAADPQPGAESELLDRERLDIVAEALAELPDESREALVLFHREGRSTRQVASLLGLSDAAVRKRLERGRHHLREDVLKRFAEVARSSAPGAAFTAAVLAATAGAPPAAAATLAAAATSEAASSTPLLSPKLLAAAGGAGLGFLGGAVGVVLGLRGDFNAAIDAEESRSLKRVRTTTLLLLFLACLGFVWTASLSHVWPLAIYFALVSSFAGIYLGWLPRVVMRRYLAEADGNIEDAQKRLRQRQRQTFIGWLCGATAGLLGLLAGLYALGHLTGLG